MKKPARGGLAKRCSSASVETMGELRMLDQRAGLGVGRLKPPGGIDGDDEVRDHPEPPGHLQRGLGTAPFPHRALRCARLGRANHHPAFFRILDIRPEETDRGRAQMLMIRVPQRRGVIDEGGRGPLGQIRRRAEPCLDAFDLLGWWHGPLR